MTDMICSTCGYCKDNKVCLRLRMPTRPGWHCMKWTDVPKQMNAHVDIAKNQHYHPIDYDFSKAVDLIEKHAPAIVSYRYVKENTGYSGSLYMIKRRLEDYPHIEWFRTGTIAGWRVKVND